MNGQPRSITTNSITLGAAIRAFEDICNDPPTPKAFGDSVRNAEWAKDYIKAISDSLDNKNLKLTNETQGKVNSAVQKCYKTIIANLDQYAGESIPVQFDRSIQAETVSYFESLNLTPFITDKDLEESKSAKARIINKFTSCSEKDNRIDWSLVNRMVESFNQIQVLHNGLADKIRQPITSENPFAGSWES